MPHLSLSQSPSISPNYFKILGQLFTAVYGVEAADQRLQTKNVSSSKWTIFHLLVFLNLDWKNEVVIVDQSTAGLTVDSPLSFSLSVALSD